MSNTLEYKGFKASIEFDDRDEIFVGRLLGLDPKQIMSFHGSSIKELKSAFKESIVFHLHAKIAAAAKRSGKSINAFGKEIFEKALT